MLRIGLEIFEFLVLLGNTAVTPQCATPKTAYELVAFADLLKPMPNLPVDINSPFEFASFGFLQHEFRPATRHAGARKQPPRPAELPTVQAKSHSRLLRKNRPHRSIQAWHATLYRTPQNTLLAPFISILAFT